MPGLQAERKAFSSTYRTLVTDVWVFHTRQFSTVTDQVSYSLTQV